MGDTNAVRSSMIPPSDECRVSEIGIIQKAYADQIEREEKRLPRQPHTYVYASSRRRCLRRMVFECSEPEAFPDFDTETKARFTRGKERETNIGTRLQHAGQLSIPKFEFVGQQSYVRVYDRTGRLVISGMIDGYIQWESRVRWPVEIKSLSQFTTDKVHTFTDLYASPYTWANAHQLLSYMFAENAPYGLFVLDRAGLPKLLQVNLEEHLEAMESFLTDATTVVDHIEAGTLPVYHEDPSECKRCPIFGSRCNPPLSFGAASIVTDEETIARTERYAELQATPEIEEFDALDKWTKERFRGTEIAIVGKCLVMGKWRKEIKYELSDEAKAAINAIKEPFAKTVEKGKFFLTVDKVSE